MDLSVRGDLVMSSRDKKNLVAVGILERDLNYDRMNKKFKQVGDRCYSEEGAIDIGHLIAKRIQAGYQVDSVERNLRLT